MNKLFYCFIATLVFIFLPSVQGMDDEKDPINFMRKGFWLEHSIEKRILFLKNISIEKLPLGLQAVEYFSLMSKKDIIADNSSTSKSYIFPNLIVDYFINHKCFFSSYPKPQFSPFVYILGNREIIPYAPDIIKIFFVQQARQALPLVSILCTFNVLNKNKVKPFPKGVRNMIINKLLITTVEISDIIQFLETNISTVVSFNKLPLEHVTDYQETKSSQDLTFLKSETWGKSPFNKLQSCGRELCLEK